MGNEANTSTKNVEPNNDVAITEQAENTNPPQNTPTQTNSDTENDLGNVKDGEGVEKNITRNKMAMVFVIGFFSVLFLIITYAFFVGSQLKELKDTIIAIVGSLSGIIGFVIGYYFKSEQEK